VKAAAKVTHAATLRTKPRDCASNHFRFAGALGTTANIARGFTRRLGDSNAIAQASREASGRSAHPNRHRVKIGSSPCTHAMIRVGTIQIGHVAISLAARSRDPSTLRHSVPSANVSMRLADSYFS
jgi:hypothetical protein